jgi:D-arabinitol dehydrogenase (NADP+)
MRAAQLIGPEQVQVTEVDDLRPGSHDVLIEVAAAGLCQADVGLFTGKLPTTYPRVPGHEFSGLVAAVGDGVRRFRPGDRVTADPNIACNWCEFCQRSQFNQCVNLSAIGITRDGGVAQHVLAPDSNVFSIGTLSFSEAALIEPLACVVWGLKRVRVEPGDRALVFGAGTVGCLVALALRASGAAQVVVTDRLDWRLEQAARHGATHVVLADGNQEERLIALSERGYDLVVEATGVASVSEQAIQFARPRGRVWIFGVAPPGARASFAPYDVFRKDLMIIGSHAVNRTFPQSVALIQSGGVKVGGLVTHRYPLDQVAEALHVASGRVNCLKVQITMS